MKHGKLAAILISLAVMAGCGGNGSSVSITISPTSTVVVLNGTQQFTATVAGSSNANANWFVSFQNGSLISGGNSTLGTISTTGLYTAPGVLPNPPTVSVVAQAAGATSITATATVTLDSGIRVVIAPLTPTMGTGETLSFSATVTGTSNTAVTWQVNGTDGGSSSTGTITSAGVFTAPSTPQTVTISAVSVADINQSASTTVTVVTAADPTLLTLEPTVTGQGSVQQTVYLNGTNFYTTSLVLANGVPVVPTILVTPTTTSSVSSVLMVTLPSNLLQNAGSIALTVQRQNGDQSAPLSLTVTPVRPAIVSALPDSASQGGSPVTVNLDGGYYSVSSPNGPHTTAEFNDVPHGVSATNTRQLGVTLSSADIATAGLFSLVLQNTGVPNGSPAFSAVNVAVQPTNIPSSPIATIPVGVQPVSVAVDTATGIAVVANKGTAPGTISLVNLATNTVTGTIQVGNGPTSVAVDNLLNEAAVVNNTDNTLSIVSLSSQTVVSTITLPSATTGYSVGINPLTHRGLVANQTSNAATVIDLSTTPPGIVCVVGGTNPQNPCSPGAAVQTVSTGPQPAIAIEQRLNWAVVAPGGSGAVTVVDLGLPATTSPAFGGRTPSVVATLTLTGLPQGIAINSQTDQSLLTDPSNDYFTEFSLLNQTTNVSTPLDKGEVADAINPLTNMAVTVNALSNQANVINMQTLESVFPAGQGIQTGLAPASVDIDPVTNEAVVANSGINANTISILSLGAIRPLSVIESSPATTYTSSAPLTLTLIGGGFDATSVVRLDQTNLLPTTVMPVGCTSNCRELVATVPATLLALPRRFILDVLQDTSLVSNVSDLTVMASIPVGNAPGGVAIDSDIGIAVVTNTVDGTINTINMATASLSSPTPIIVGSDPQGVAILPQSSEAVVTNFGSNNASIVNLIQGTVTTVNTGEGPLGVSINPETTTAVVANSTSNSLTLIDIDTAQTTGTINTDMFPLATAVDPALNYAAVTATGAGGPLGATGTVVLYNLANDSTVGRISNLNLPSGIVFDPVGDMFVAANSLQNNIVLINPLNLLTTSVSTGINPYSLDYNFQTSTLVTANSLGGTLSVMDYLSQQVEAVLPVGNSSMFSVAIDPLTNMAVVADQANNRVLIIPLPH